MKRIILILLLINYGTTILGQNTLGGGVVFSEILIDPNGSTDNFDTDGDGTAEGDDEFIELYNTSSSDINISGWELWDENSGSNSVYTFPGGLTLKAGAFLVIVNDIAGGSLPTVTGDNIALSANGALSFEDAGNNLALYNIGTNNYIQIKYNGDSDYSFSELSGATRIGSIEDFGNDSDGNSIARTPPWGTSFDLNKTVCNCSDLASPGSASSTIISWDGSSSSDWDNSSNWDGNSVPTSSDNVIIAAAGADPIIVAGIEASCDNLLINSSASLTVSSGGSLAIYGSATNNGTYSVEKTVTGGTGSMNSAGYSIIGSPVETETIDDLSADFVYGYINGVGYDASNQNTSTATMTAGVGYFVGYDAISPTLNVTGDPNSGDIMYTVSESSGFELVANPYAAAIDVADFLSDNTIITGGIYLWDDGGSNVGSNRGGDYVSVNAMGSATAVEPNGISDGVSGGTGSTPANDGYIASVQGFFVEVTSSGTITFKPLHQVTTDGSNDESDHYRTEPYQKVKLAIEGNGLYNEVLIGFGEDATYGVDRMLDSKKLVTDNPLSFYSLIENDKYVIQALPALSSETINTQLGFDLSEKGHYTVQVVEFKNIPSNIIVYLLDHKTGLKYELKESTKIPFDTEITESDNRFELVFSTSAILSVVDNAPYHKVFGNTSSINIESNLEGNNKIRICSMDGRIVYHKEVNFSSSSAVIDISLNPNEIYILTIGNKSTKFIIE